MNSIIKKKWNSVSTKFIIQDSMSLKFQYTANDGKNYQIKDLLWVEL